jgi:toxin CcdB
LRQFDVFQNPNERSRRIAPLIVVVQSHLLEELPTVLVAPLLHASERPAYSKVSCAISLGGADYTLSLAELVALDARALAIPVANLVEHEDTIRRALDRVFTGF